MFVQGPGIVAKYQLKFVFYIVPAGLIKYFFVSSKLRRDEEASGNHRNIKTKTKNKEDKEAAGNSLRDLPEWLEEFTDNPEETEVPAAANISPESDSERPTEVAARKHSIYIHIPKDRNCEVCKRTQMTRAPCRRRRGEAVPREEKFGDLITADHKVFSEEGESRNNHRCAVVVQDLATQSHPCKTKTSQETEESSRKILEQSHKPKVMYTDNSMEFGTSCEDLS